jgi:hypothetical protein
MAQTELLDCAAQVAGEVSAQALREMAELPEVAEAVRDILDLLELPELAVVAKSVSGFSKTYTNY